MKNYKHLTSAELVNRFENACFKTNYPNNKAYSKEFGQLEKELMRRLEEKEGEKDNYTTTNRHGFSLFRNDKERTF